MRKEPHKEHIVLLKAIIAKSSVSKKLALIMLTHESTQHVKRKERDVPTTGMYDNANETDTEVTIKMTRYADDAIVVRSLRMRQFQ